MRQNSSTDRKLLRLFFFFPFQTLSSRIKIIMSSSPSAPSIFRPRKTMYVTALYFTMTCMTSVGFGNVIIITIRNSFFIHFFTFTFVLCVCRWPPKRTTRRFSPPAWWLSDVSQSSFGFFFIHFASVSCSDGMEGGGMFFFMYLHVTFWG